MTEGPDTPQEPPRPAGWQSRSRRITAQDFSDVKKGDRVTRLLAEVAVMPGMLVTDVDENFIYLGGEEGWKFDRKTGFEVDEELHFGPEWGVTCSRLLRDDAS